MKNLRELSAWKQLEEHFYNIKNLKMKDMFDYDDRRSEKYSFELNNIYFDISKNRANFDTYAHFVDLIKSFKLQIKIKKLFSGEKLNHTENRAALHSALRHFEEFELPKPDSSILNNILDDRDAFLKKAQEIIDDKNIEYVVHIGIGGSNVGPKLVNTALQDYSNNRFKIFYISNIDQSELNAVFEKIDPDKTIFLIASKSLGTSETLFNFKEVLKNLNLDKPDNRFYALTANTERAKDLGFVGSNVLRFNDNIGGRYSVWSSIGLTVALNIGVENFKSFLKGAAKADEHFYNEDDYFKNIPTLLAFLNIWYRNFFDLRAKAVVPYSDKLSMLPTYLQQLEMESLGKIIDNEGEKVQYATGSTVFGGVGTNVQHSFFQMLHQGVDIVPVDFIAVLNSGNESDKKLFANCLAQSKALMNGRHGEETLEYLKEKYDDNEEVERLLPYNISIGNIPSNTFVMKELTPETLGTLLAVNEHKVFVQSVIWDINPYDQFGVEFGKKLAVEIEESIDSGNSDETDSSTRDLIELYLKQKGNQ